MKKPNNLVAKHAHINKAVTMRDKKKDYLRKEKHKKKPGIPGIFHIYALTFN